MNEYKKVIREKFNKGEIVELLERKKRQLHNLENTIFDNGTNDRKIERLTKEIKALNELYNEI